jgi:hypothetical protein
VSAKVAIFLRKKSENSPYFKTMSSKKGGERQNKIGFYKISTSLYRMTFSQIWLIPLLDDHQPANLVWVTTIKYTLNSIARASEGCPGYWFRESNCHGYCGNCIALVITQTMFYHPPPPKDVGRRKKRKERKNK